MRNLGRKAQELADAKRDEVREEMVERTMIKYDLTKLPFTRIFVPAILQDYERNADVDWRKSDEAVLDDKQGTDIPADKAASNANETSAQKITRRPIRPFKRCVRVFDPEEVARVKDIAKAATGDTKKRYESTLKIAEVHEGYRKLPMFKNIGSELSRIADSFGNFRSVLDHYAEEMTLSCASKPESFRISPVLLDGDPGIGKTAFAQAFASILGLPFCKLSAGGMQHASILTGTASHWSTAQSGEVFNLISHSPWASAVLLIDEADKLCNRQEYAILPALLDLLEPESARRYKEESIGLQFDASRLIVLMTSNNMSSMDAALLSRCRAFTIQPPGVEQRIQIASRVHNDINSALRRNQRIDLDSKAVRQLSEADIDIRALIMAVRNACSQAIRTGSKMAVPEMPPPKSIKREIGFIRTGANARHVARDDAGRKIGKPMEVPV